VRDTATVSASIPRIAETVADPVQVRDATSLLLNAIAASYGSTVSRQTALRVPAVARAYKVFTHTISCFPLREYAAGEQIVPRAFLANPSQITTYSSLMARTVGDLILNDAAYWRVTSRSWDGFPQTAEHMPYAQVSTSPQTTADAQSEYKIGTVHWNGTPIPDRDVLRFDGDGTGGWLTVGVDAITTAASLEAAVLRTAEVPQPSIVLKNTGADLPADQVDALLDAWESARSNRTTAYLNSTLETHSLTGWSPNDLQLVEARNAASAMIARVANLDPIWCGAGVPGSSLVYQNRIDLRKDLVDLALRPVMSMVAQRLSMNDVTPRGHQVEFDTDVFLRANTTDLADVIAAMQPLGVITTDEARSLLDLEATT
jgi:phage portal protein BeeE